MTENEMVDGITCSMDMSLSKLQELVMGREVYRVAEIIFLENKSDHLTFLLKAL